ncbi:hypothetical protein CKO28_25940 [Rhodovibrio sodomensis]|uniref:NorR-like AAA+ ATPase lid domain-containing protein n=1 Tax=Rhodovibrio sodomensis TaxID=1088 RepID=A0ABS1DLN7_9PROT|nr:hypothetical protein [Rhodovibrio sodomensis]MBK1671445.1 hypothetical protein [Rhodovibrio sodomensis]
MYVAPPVTLDPGAVRAAEAFAWAGNVRELRNRLGRAIALSPDGRIGPDDLFPDAPAAAPAPAAPSAGSSLAETRAAAERALIARVLGATGGN